MCHYAKLSHLFQHYPSVFINLSALCTPVNPVYLVTPKLLCTPVTPVSLRAPVHFRDPSTPVLPIILFLLYNTVAPVTLAKELWPYFSFKINLFYVENVFILFETYTSLA